MTERRKHTLPTDSAERKAIPLHSGCDLYFPAILAAIAQQSLVYNEKHNPGEPMHHARGKSTDHADCIRRHLIDLAESPDGYETIELPDGRKFRLPIVAAIAWRACALGQEWLEQHAGAPLAPGARLPEQAELLRGEQIRDAFRRAGIKPWAPPAEPLTVRGACFHIDSVRCDNCRDVPLPPEPGISTVTSTGTGTVGPAPDLLPHTCNYPSFGESYFDYCSACQAEFARPRTDEGTGA